jgi:phosphatidate cytidylyltransferase
MLRQRVITAVILLVIILGALFYAPPWLWGVLSLALMTAAAAEWAVLTVRGPHARRQALLIAAPVALAGLAYLGWRDPAAPLPAWVNGLLAADLLLWIVFALPSVLSARLLAAGSLPTAAFGVFAMLCLWLSMFELRLDHPVLVFSAMAIVWCADIGAYFFGRAYGRRKLAVRVSPGKSWEGAVGGLVTVLLTAALAWWLFPQAPVLSSAVGLKAGVAVAVFALVMIVALSIIGDLFESLLKRSKGVKDSGSLLPGHGGVLDRIDALIPTMPACLLLWWMIR